MKLSHTSLAKDQGRRLPTVLRKSQRLSDSLTWTGKSIISQKQLVLTLIAMAKMTMRMWITKEPCGYGKITVLPIHLWLSMVFNLLILTAMESV